MKNCPQCGQSRQGDDLKCPSCDVFYSPLDELLYEEQQKQEASTFKGLINRIRTADDRKQACTDELKTLWRNTPLQTKISLFTIAAFVFALVVSVM